MTPEADLNKLVQEQSFDAAAGLVWVRIYRSGGTTQAELEAALGASAAEIKEILDGLIRAGRVTEDEEEGTTIYRAAQFVVPVGSSEGWEAAVFDHFQAVANAISQKLTMLERRSAFEDEVGGTTLSFDVYDGHPYQEQVRGLLAEVRKKTDNLWDEVAAYNQDHPLPEGHRKVTFYAGQSIQGPDE